MKCEYCDRAIADDNYMTLEQKGVVHDACNDLYEMFRQRRKVQDITLDAFRGKLWVKDLEADGNIKTAGCRACGACGNS